MDYAYDRRKSVRYHSEFIVRLVDKLSREYHLQMTRDISSTGLGIISYQEGLSIGDTLDIHLALRGTHEVYDLHVRGSVVWNAHYANTYRLGLSLDEPFIIQPERLILHKITTFLKSSYPC
jgi:hypothetical protein